MSDPNCPNNCVGCPWQTDPHNSDRRVCVKCGRDYNFRRSGFFDLLLVLAIPFIILLFMNPSSQSSQYQYPEQPESQNLNVTTFGDKQF